MKLTNSILCIFSGGSILEKVYHFFYWNLISDHCYFDLEHLPLICDQNSQKKMFFRFNTTILTCIVCRLTLQNLKSPTIFTSSTHKNSVESYSLHDMSLLSSPRTLLIHVGWKCISFRYLLTYFSFFMADTLNFSVFLRTHWKLSLKANTKNYCKLCWLGGNTRIHTRSFTFQLVHKRFSWILWKIKK